jgi:ornithine cyclodeaminase/alanine dehydrogenase-like protein (mu-crystallin family)
MSSNVEEVTKKCDILVTCTCNERYAPPIVKSSWIRSSMHINAIGWDIYTSSELEEEISKRAKIVVDTTDPSENH